MRTPYALARAPRFVGWHARTQGLTTTQEINLMKKQLCLLTAIIMLCLMFEHARAQSEDVPRFEVGAQFTTLTKPDFDGGRTEPGFGGRFTYNLTDYLALEAEGDF